MLSRRRWPSTPLTAERHSPRAVQFALWPACTASLLALGLFGLPNRTITLMPGRRWRPAACEVGLRPKEAPVDIIANG